MTSEKKQPTAPRPSASLIIVRDSESGLEVLMVRRNPALRLGGGFLVYPGGVLDEADYQLSSGKDELDAFRVNAIRETFEETSLFFGRSEGDLHRNREQLLAGDLTFNTIYRQAGLSLELDRLYHMAHWITPEALVARFSTHFFIAEYNGAAIDVDGGEIVESIWITPGELVAKGESGQEKLMFPTLMNARRLMQFDSVAQILRWVETYRVEAVMPRAEFHGGMVTVTIPESAGLGITEWSFPNPLRRVSKK